MDRSVETVTVEVTPPPPPAPAAFVSGAARSPGGGVFAANARYLTRDGAPWLPVMGEFHYTRFPRAGWDEQIRKMKAAGVGVVSTYIIWQHHQERPGVFDFTGNRDLRAFVEICARYGLLVWLRPGPWVHAEVRFGGIPDFVVERCFTRSNDPLYLASVKAFFDAVGEQTRGLLWKDGGPVIGLQIENEYNRVGPLQGREHIAALKALAVEAGLDVPYYTVTGWDNAVWPKGAALPVFGTYVDEPWSLASGVLPPKSSFAFQYGTRVEWGLGAIGGVSEQGDADRDYDSTPFLGAEYGAGVPTMYRRRPLVEPEDIAAMVVTKLGSGINLLGYYMFQGGQNPPGSPSREENTAIGGYNDLPKLGYDFQAPLGQYGQAHPVLRRLRPLHAFLGAFGGSLATMPVHAPARVPADAADLETLRWSVRSDGDSGFLFVNNHVRQHPMAEHRGVVFTVRLGARCLTVPPLDIRPGESFVWPLRLDLGGIRLTYATAQPVTRVQDGAGEVFVFLARLHGPCRFAFDAADGVTADAPATASDGQTVFDVTPGTDLLTVRTRDGRTVRLLVLPASQADRLAVLPLHRCNRLILSEAHVFEGEAGGIELRQTGDATFDLRIFPAIDTPPGWQRAGTDGAFGLYETSVPAKAPAEARITLLRPPLPVSPPPRTGPEASVAQPFPETFGAAGRWRIALPEGVLDGVSDAFLRIAYRGDIARLFADEAMIDDHFYNGPAWVIGLKRYAGLLAKDRTLSVLPLRHDSPVTFDPSVRLDGGNAGQIAEVIGVEVVYEYAAAIQ